MCVYIERELYIKPISKRLANISCNKNVFDRNVDIYQAALKNSGFDGKITFKVKTS